MQRHVTLRLFRQGTAAEVTLTFLLLLAVALLFTDALWKSSNPARQTIATFVYPFQRLVLLPKDALNAFDGWLNAASLIKTENEALQRQRIEMAQVTTRAALLTAENEQLRRLLGVLEKAADRPAVVVEVLYEPSSTFVRRIVFNKGSRAGIAPGMPVIDESGVVGQITRVTAMTAEAAMLTDEAVSIPVQVLRNGLRLIAFGSGSPGKVEVRYFSSDADIKDGDTLVTSGVGGVFPPGLFVGRIDRVERSPASGFARAEAKPLSHPERNRHFLVLQVSLEAEQALLTPSVAPPGPQPVRAPTSGK